MKRKQIGWVAPAYGGGAIDTDWCVYVIPGDSDVPVVLARFGARRRARQWLRGYRKAWVARGPRIILAFPPPSDGTFTVTHGGVSVTRPHEHISPF